MKCCWGVISHCWNHLDPNWYSPKPTAPCNQPALLPRPKAGYSAVDCQVVLKQFVTAWSDWKRKLTNGSPSIFPLPALPLSLFILLLVPDFYVFLHHQNGRLFHQNPFHKPRFLPILPHSLSYPSYSSLFTVPLPFYRGETIHTHQDWGKS